MADVEVTEDIAADPKVVYDLVSDVTRMGEWSPETTSCQWLGGSGPAALGSKFRGTNKRLLARWTTTCTVTAADPGRRFAFDVRWGPWAISQWSYDIEPTAEGCHVTEAWVDRRGATLRVSSPAVMGIVDRAAHNRRGMETTLAALRAAAENHT
ncbi:MAG: SRPBCC family protein [Sporichthyaceae bacterium]